MIYLMTVLLYNNRYMFSPMPNYGCEDDFRECIFTETGMQRDSSELSALEAAHSG